jgi:hypothetical protein
MSNGIATNLFSITLALAAAGCDVASTEPASRRDWQLTRDGVAADARTQVTLPGWIWAREAYACAPSLAVGPQGEAIVTSNVVPTLWRIDPKTLAVTEHRLTLDADDGRDIGFSGLAYSAEQGAYFAMSEPFGSLWKIDLQLKRAQKIPLSQALPGACGLTALPRSAQAAKSLRAARLCTASPEGRWSIDLAADQRSAYARGASGRDCPWLPASLALQGD